MPITLRHVKRDPAGTDTLLGEPYVGDATGLNDDSGFAAGSYESRVYQEGNFGCVLPNGYGTDAVAHQARFGITQDPLTVTSDYRPIDEFIEVWDGAVGDDLLHVACITGATMDRSSIALKGYDPRWLLKKAREYQAGYWHSAPRDMWEHYTSVWKAYLAEDFSGAALTGRFATSGTTTSPDGVGLRIGSGGGYIKGAAAGVFPIGLGSAQPHQHWQVKVVFTRNRFGTELVAPFGGNAYVRVGIHNTVTNADLMYIQLQEKYTYLRGPTPVPGAPDPMSVNAQWQSDPPGPFEVVVEGRGRWVYFLVNQTLLGCLPMPSGSTNVVPFISLDPGTSTASPHADVSSMLLRRTQPLLMRSTTQKGDYRLPGAPPPGGLWGRYYDDNDIEKDDSYPARVFSPERDGLAGMAQRLDKTLNFTVAGGFAINPPKWQPVATNGLWFSVRWCGAIYLNLADGDQVLEYTTDQEGARMWVGKTRMGEQYIDNWYVGLGGTKVGGSLRTHIGHESDGAYHNGWYPIMIEYGQRGTAGASFKLAWSGGTVVPSSHLSPYGIYHDQVRLDSHYDVLAMLQDTFGYQSAVVPQPLESGNFPGLLLPQVRVGRDTDVVVNEDDLELEELQTVIDAEEAADAILGDGSGLATDTQGAHGQLVAEALRFDILEAQTMLMSDSEDWGEINYAPLLQQRADSLLALRSTPWEEVRVQNPAVRELADTFPVTGVLAQFDWTAGDGVRLNLPVLGVVDTVPRQLLGIVRPFVQVGLQAPNISFKQRPRGLGVMLRNIQRRLARVRHHYQGQVVRVSGSVGYQSSTDALHASYLVLPRDLSRVARCQLSVFEKPDATAYNVYVNGVQIDYPPITDNGIYDITAAVARWLDPVTGAAHPHMEITLEP